MMQRIRLTVVAYHIILDLPKTVPLVLLIVLQYADMAEKSVPVFAITCVDNRLHYPSIVPQLEEILESDSVYLETMPGPEGCIIGRKDDPHNYHLKALVCDLALLIEAKGINTVALIGHCDCAGHPVSDDQHETDICIAAKILQEALPQSITIIPLLAHPPQQAGPWQIERLDATKHTTIKTTTTPNTTLTQ